VKLSLDNIAAASILSSMNFIQLSAARASTAILQAACLLPFFVACGCSGHTGASRDSAAAPAKATDNGAVAAATKAPASSTKTVELVIDYGDGVQKRFTDIGWKESMTVLDALRAAQQHSHGISFAAHGSGETAIVSKIDDETNQGGATGAKNWIFRINGHLGDESCGIAEVRPGDTVLWKFGAYE
jgi:hypothetical protein